MLIEATDRARVQPSDFPAIRPISSFRHALPSMGLVFALCALLLLVPRPIHAAPVAPFPLRITQPDGSQFEAMPFGDEWESGYETLDGYTIVRDPATGYWRYAARNSVGELTASAAVVAEAAAPGWTKHLRDARATPARVPAPAPGQAQLQGHIGTERVLVLLVQFPNRPSLGSSAADWSQLYFGASNGLQNYYNEVSYGQLSLRPCAETHGTANDGVVGWLTLGYNHPNTRQDTGNANRALVRDAILAADPYVNFAQYDSNGDGYIGSNELHIAVVVAGYESSYGGGEGSCSPGVWGHQWALGFQYDGVRVEAPRVDGKYVAQYQKGGYTQTGEWHCRADDTPGHLSTMGVSTHEMGHDLDWPDLYDTDFSSYGVGYWSVMGSGSWLDTGGYRGTRPAHPDAWCKWFQGWLTPERVTGTRSGIVLQQVESSRRVLQLLDNPGGVAWDWYNGGVGEYFLIENRQRVSYDAGLPGCGLLIWHVDESRKDNEDDAHRLVHLEQADGLNDLTSMTNAGDAGDPYPGTGNNRTFHNTSNPNSRLYSGASSGVVVTNISAACSGSMSADVTTPGGPIPTATRQLGRGIYLPIARRNPIPVGTPTPTPSGRPGNPVEIAVCVEGYDQLRPAVAYNPTRQEYLVVYQWGRVNSDIHAQRVSRNGALQGQRVVVAGTGERDRAPQVACNTRNNEYLVVWHGGDGEEVANSRNYIYGQRLSGAGGLLGSTIPICTSTRWNISSTVAYNSVNNEYLVVWQDGIVNINGQRISASGSPIGSSFVICGANRQQNDASVAYNPHANEYLVVFDDHRNNMNYDIYGKRVSGAGSVNSQDIAICTLTGDQLYPDVGYCPATNGYLVAWPDLRTGSLYPDLYYNMVSEMGLVGSVTPLSMAQWGQLDPDVAYDPAANQYLVVWTNNRPWEVYGQRLSPQGALAGAELHFTTNPSKQHQPAIAIDPSSGAYLVAWEDYRSERDFDIYAYVQP